MRIPSTVKDDRAKNKGNREFQLLLKDIITWTQLVNLTIVNIGDYIMKVFLKYMPHQPLQRHPQKLERKLLYFES